MAALRGQQRRRRWAVKGEEEGEEEEEGPSVLSLSHFSRPPFLSFGRVPVGTACLRRLAVENPNAEPVSLALHRPPPAEKGFALEQTHSQRLLQPGERIFISITWTPLEGGKIRELITFVVNGVVKHQAVLLGTAEQPIKKKKRLWDTIKKRTPLQQSRCKKKLPIIKNVNKTLQMSQKTDGARSPLQSCENLEMNKDTTSPNGDSLIVLENNLSLSPINPILQENQHVSYTPFSLRRSTTCSVIGTASCDELLKDVKETCTVNPLCDYLVETKLKSPPHISSTEEQNSNTNLVCTPEQNQYVSLKYRRILSPDSFVNNSYELTEELCVGATAPILSPDQFLKENQIAIQPLLQVHKSVPPSSNVKQTEKTKAVFFPVEPHFSNSAFNDIKDRKYALQTVTKVRKTGKDQTSCLQKEKTKKKPVLSNTVTKSKPNLAERKEAVCPKSRKCLSNAIQECVDIAPESAKLEMLRRLPVIEPISGEIRSSDLKATSAQLESVSCGRKRKSGEYMTVTDNGNEAYEGEIERKKIQRVCVEKEIQSALKIPVPKSVNRERQRPKQRPDSLSQKFRTVRRTRSVVPIAQSQLTFVIPLKTDIPRHPMPFVAKNMFFDERWKEKQQRGFTWWLNFVLTPDDFTVKTDISQVNAATLNMGIECHHKSSVPKAPTKEEASLRAYTARCKLNKLRRSACRLFTCEEKVKAIRKLEIEIETKRLLVRKDRHLWKDIGERQKILNWLLCYNPLWLRIGLETVYGELIALESNSDVMGLAVFILNRLLWNPDIAAEYRHPTVPHLYRDGHEEALSKFTLKKILLLVCFLDHAKLSRIIDHDPCLFCKNAEFKSSKEILLAFSRDFLSGEGDLSRHLGFLGLPVNHVQTPLDEFDFAVTNLATDLQCGIRLVRALELLSSDWSLSKKLRIPAISRLQKMHNVNIVLQVLKDHGIDLKDEYGAKIDAKDIVDRHREKTFALLWKIVFAFQVDISLDKDQVKEEIEFLKNLHISKMKTALQSFAYSHARKESNSFYSSENYSENVKLLMDWVNAVCHFYNVTVENFTVSFSDGRVLCYLIHHYHPCYVAFESICQRTTQTVECTKNGTIALNSSSESDASLNLLNGSFDQTITTSPLYKELLDNEKKNFQLIDAAVSHLGGIPEMIHYSDMSNTIPDEKVVIIYLSFLCARLLELSKEIRAARLIQTTWRKYRQKIKVAQMKQQKLNATVVLQKYWRRYLAQMELQKLKKSKQEETEKAFHIVLQKQHKAAVVLQAWYKMKKQRKLFLRMSGAAAVIQRCYRAYRKKTSLRLKFLEVKKAVVCLQAAYRGYKLRKMLRYQNMAAVKIQAAFRAHTARVKYQTLIQASCVIQKWYRASTTRKQFLKTKASVISLQAAVRGWQIRKRFKEQHTAAVIIQSAFRRYSALKRFRMVKNAVLTLQQHYRARMSSRKQQEYIVLCNNIILIQAAWRGSLVRRQMQKQHQAAVIIQCYYRMHVSQTNFKRFRGAAVVIQRWYQGVILARKKREEYLALKEATIKMQAIYRSVRVRQKLKCRHKAAVRIQAMFRMHQCNVKYAAMKLSATVIQRRYRAFCRGRREQKKYQALRKSCIILQSAYRGMKVRQELKTLRHSVTSLQSFYRMHRQRKAFLQLIAAVKLIQQWYRGCKDRNTQMQKYMQVKKSILQIQSGFRGMKVRLHLKRMHTAATIIQRRFRTFIQRRSFLSLKAAAVTIQRKYRGIVLSKQQREQYLCLCNAAIIIQSVFRGQIARKSVKRRNAAATVIQAAFRMHIAYIQYQAVKLASVTIQRHYRTYRKTKHLRELYLKQHQSVLLLQAAYRGMKTRLLLKKWHDAAMVIQSNYRKYRQQCYYIKLQWAAKVIQVRFRANKLQKIAVHQYICVKRATICIQKAFRRMKARQYQKRHQAAIVLQRSFKMQRERRRYMIVKTTTILLQRKYRASILARKQAWEYSSFCAAVCIQSFYRGFRVRKEVEHMHLAARMIQASFRMHRTRRSYQRLRNAAVTIQNYYRSYLKGKHQKNAYLAIRRSAVVLQATYRGIQTRQELKAMHISATVIQSFYRMHMQYRHYRRIRWAVITIQSAYRGTVGRKKAKEMHAAMIQSLGMDAQNEYRKSTQHSTEALVLQDQHYRVYHRELYQKYWEAALLIQQHYRSYLAMKHERAAYLQTLRSIIILQAAVRGFLERQRFHRMKRSVIKMQALWRGHSWRKRTDTAETRALRDSLVIANKKSKEEEKLCNRTALAIDRLLKYKHFSYILAALKELEVVTRLSPVCCESMAKTEAVSTIFTLIRSCNRSVPCMDVIRHSVQVLLNLSKYERTTDTVYAVERCVETLLDLLQMYRDRAGDKISDKGGSIFIKTCCLFALLSEDSRRASEIRSSPQVVARLQSLYRLTVRKHRMDAQRNLVRQKSAAYINGRSVPVSPLRTKVVSRQRPAWVLKKDNIQEIVDPLQAIQMVMDTLGISCT
ncbi:abnormal spindle-like microcephaly-associated protein isoform X2 [Sceloporus undulatus]|uniref:abnormal spindle-like microcephaly-associated protein isoform X2 n=1 Tax=Sceloporus undulatus TaxID=8520 RepID=UPI001C4C34C1|nr:abnormal spindle-like microcephaly-associated protein isoform X2 [Sceloporus undulatus]